MAEISVIIPVYNIEPYIGRCIETVLCQTFTDFELILVDDGSTDGGGRLCDEYSKKDGRITVIHQKNEGVSEARNNGVDAARGDYLLFIDGDDTIDKETLKILHNNIISENSDMSVCEIKKAYDESDCFKITNSLLTFSGREAVEYFGMINKANFYSVCAKLVKKDIPKKIRFTKGRMFSEDRAVLYKWYFESSKISYTDSVLYKYNMREDSVVGGKYDYYMLAELDTEKEMLEFFKQNDFPNLYYKFAHNYVNEIARQHDELIKTLNDKAKAKELKKLLKETVKREKKECDIRIEKDPVCYNALYPRRAEIYWLLKGAFGKIKKIARN